MRIVYFLIFLFPFTTAAQELLVNGGFEEENICVEYKVNCAPEGWIYTVPSFVHYFNEPANANAGAHYIAVIAGNSNKPLYRTFVRSRLLCGLQKGKTYRLQLSVKSMHPILDSMGIYFSSYDFLFEKQAYHKINASIYLTNAKRKPAVSDTAWQKITMDYIANGTEVFIAIGNFKKTGVGAETGIEKENNFFALFDDVSLRPVDGNERLCVDWKKTEKEIYAQDERHEYLARSISDYKKNPTTLQTITPTKTLKVDTLIIPDVFFSTNSFMLNRQSTQVLDSFIKIINKKPMDSIVVHGHTDTRGEEMFNEELSWKRASTVTAFLQSSVQSKFYTKGWGSRKPVVSNNTAPGRQRNRRVEIYLYLKE